MKTFLCAVILLLSCHCYSQTTTAKDTLIWSDGTIYTGTVIKREKGKVDFKTEDGVVHSVASSSIALLKQANILDNKLPPTERTSSPSGSSTNNSDAPVNWSDPAIPKKVLVKHNTGIGLTVTGTIFMVAGIGMIAGGAANNGQVTTNNTGYSTQTNVNIGAVGAIGIVAVIAGLPMMISGAVKLKRAKKMARIAVIHLE